MKPSAPCLLAGIALAVVILFLSGCATAPQTPKVQVQQRKLVTESTLFYSGLTYAGAKDKIAARYPYTLKADAMLDGGLGKVCSDYFAALSGEVQADGMRVVELNPQTKLKLGLAHSHDAPLAFSVGLTQEVVLREKMQAQGTVKKPYKLIVSLYFNLLVLDFSEKEVVTALPFTVTKELTGERPFSDDDIASLIKEMFTGAGEKDFAARLGQNLPYVGGRGKNMARMQVKSVALGDHVSQYMPEDLNQGASRDTSYEEQLGNQLTGIFGTVANVAMLPFAKDDQNAQMALCLDKGDQVNFTIPSPSYTLCFELNGIRKTVGEQNAVRTIWAYAADGSASIRMPLPDGPDKILYTGNSSANIKKYQVNSVKDMDEFPTIAKLLELLFQQIADAARKDAGARANAIDKCSL